MKHETEYDWSALNRECSDIIKDVIKDWRDLIAADKCERFYQKFLCEHAGLFFGDSGTCLTIGQLQLGTKYRPDLVVAHDFRSGGVLYELIELKRPSHLPFNTGGLPSQHLNRALKQVSEWRNRIVENCSEVKDRMPAPHPADRRCAYTIIIGTRDNTGAREKERNRLADSFSHQSRLNIRSYDYLTDKLIKSRFVRSSPNHLFGDDLTLNRLANPFTKAFTDKSWRSLLLRVQQSSTDRLAVFQDHFLSCARNEVVEALTYNPLLEKFAAKQG